MRVQKVSERVFGVVARVSERVFGNALELLDKIERDTASKSTRKAKESHKTAEGVRQRRMWTPLGHSQLLGDA